MIDLNNNKCLEVLAKLSNRLITLKSLDNLCNCLIDQIKEIVACSQASLMLFDPNTRLLQLMKARGFKTEQYKVPRVELTNDVAKWIYEGGEILAPSGREPGKFLIIFDEDERKYFDCEMRIPFISEDKFIGVLNLGKKSLGTEYTIEDIHLLQVLVNMSTLAINNAMHNGDLSSAQITNQSFEHTKNLKIKHKAGFEEFIGQSDCVKKIHHLIEKVAANDVTVLITGDSGTGKELVARAIHQSSDRGSNPLVALNCAALPETLVESELFGHEKGAFTGAHFQKKGKFEIANGSTLFLDEIGDMSLATQAKVLRVLQDKTIHRIGGNKSLKVDVRIIVATHKNLSEEIRKGNFREDLYYRINVVNIHIPPLRERKQDIPLIADYFLKKYTQFYGKEITKINEKSLRCLMEYEFPGNVRELQHLIERAVIMEQDDQLTFDFFPFSSHTEKQACDSLVSLEKQHIKKILNQVNYNKSQAARLLGIARKTLREKMQRYGL